VLRFFTKHKGAAVAAVFVLLALTLAVSSFFTKGRVSPVSNAINTVFRPLHALIGSAADYFENVSDAMNRYNELMAEYESLRVYVANMEQERRSIDEIMEENALLRELLDLQLRERGFDFEIASVISRSTSEWERTLTLSKGSEAGVEVGQCVISSQGYLVGIVSQAGSGWATVRTVTDTAMAAGGKVSRTGQAAVAEGEWHLMREGRLRLSYLPLGSDILHGDLVVTSGLGGIYPPDIPIGTVAGMQADLSGQAEYAELIPMVRADALTQVFIVLEFISKE
jgi:rod shape-determining protein MreC